MKLNTIQDVQHFKEVIDNCKDSVWLSSENEHYNLKSALSQLVAIGKVLSGDESLELFASNKEDEQHLLGMFNTYPEMM